MGFQAGIAHGQSSTYHPRLSTSTLQAAGTGKPVQGRQPSRDTVEEDAGPAQGSFYTLRKLTCWWLLPDTVWGTYRQEELALLLLGGGQVSFTYCFSSAPCFA